MYGYNENPIIASAELDVDYLWFTDMYHWSVTKWTSHATENEVRLFVKLLAMAGYGVRFKNDFNTEPSTPRRRLGFVS